MGAGCDSCKGTIVAAQSKVLLFGGQGRTGIQLAEALLEEGYFVTAIVPELPIQPGVLELRNPVLATGITQDFSVAMSERTNESGSQATLLKPKKVLNKLGPHSRLQVITAENKQEVI